LETTTSMTDLQLLFLYLLLYNREQQIVAGRQSNLFEELYEVRALMRRIEEGTFYSVMMIEEMVQDYDDFINVIKYPDKQTWNEREIEQGFINELLEAIS
jgi:hypothetical protein